jgi:hypothetical protein
LSTATAPGHRLATWVSRRLDRYDRDQTGARVVVAWIVTRLLTLAVLATLERFVVGDVFYYWRKIEALSDVGLPQTLNEYPTPVTWLLWLPYGVTGGSRSGYLVAFIVFMLALDAVFTWTLWRTHRNQPSPDSLRAIDFWLVFVPLIGPLSYLRFDILPAVLAGGALLAARSRPWVAGALTGLGAALKLWPALLIPAFLAHGPGRKSAGWSFVGVGVGLALVSLVAGGWSRLLSPLTWQSDRGLQIESVWATPVMVARAIRPSGWVVDISRYQAYEIFGPWVSSVLVVSTVATVLGLLAIGALAIRAFRALDASAHTSSAGQFSAQDSPRDSSADNSSALAVGLVVLATVAIMTVTNKTLSPQYLLWMGGPMAALLVLVGRGTDFQRAAIRRVAVRLLVLALLTHLVYPLFYDGLLGRQGHAMIVASTLVTAVRNVALVVFTVQVTGLAWRWLSTSTSPARPSPAADAGR